MQLLKTQALRCREILQKLTRKPDEQDPMHARVSVRAMLEEAAGPSLRQDRHHHFGGPAAETTRRRPSPGRRSAPARRHLRPRQHHRERRRVRRVAGGCHGRWNAARLSCHDCRRRSGLSRRDDGQYRRALCHDAAGGRATRAEHEDIRPDWALGSSSPRRCWSVPAPPSASPIAPAPRTGRHRQVSWPRAFILSQ